MTQTEGVPSSSDPSGEKLALEIQKLTDENIKLSIEARKLKNDDRLIWRIASIIGPWITAFVAFAGVGISLYTLDQQGKLRSEEANDKAFQQALSMATDSQAGSDRRISGIYQLRRFWKNDPEAEIVAATIASLLTISDDKVSGAAMVRCAAADLIDAYAKTKGSNSHSDVPRLLYGNAEKGSLGLISYQNFILRRTAEKQSQEVERGVVDANRACISPLAATREAVRKGWADLSNVNLQSTDLDGALLYQADLTHSNLSRAWLRAASLRCANISYANISGIVINEDTDMTLAVANSELFSDQILVSYEKEGKKWAYTAADALREKDVIELEDHQWMEWKRSKFDGQKLIDLTGGKLPERVKNRRPDLKETIHRICWS
jgi:hypothetical protein